MTAAILTGVLMLAGTVWFVVMLRAMFGILRLAGKGRRLRTYNRLGMWDFAGIRADVGPAAEPHLRTMRRGGFAFLALFAAVLAAAGIGAIATAMNTGNP